MPLFHVGGIVRNLLAPVLSGGSTIVCTGFDPHAFWSHALEMKATWYYAAPTMHHAILSTKPDAVIPEHLHLRLICNAAGALLPSLASELRQTFGAVVLPSYGMTEYTFPVQSNIRAAYMSLSIRCAVCVRGLPTFDGYEISSDPSVPLDRSAFSSEGRSKEIINRGGKVISPLEVEEAIVTVAEGFVKEAIGVVIVPQEDRPSLGLRQLYDLLKGHLHPSKWPFVVVYMDDIPKNSTGKPLRIGLAKRLGLKGFTSNDPALHRHFEAIAPSISQHSEEPIACSKNFEESTICERCPSSD
ncbi:acetyl-CoA synthetase-like protein [Phlegmacium glaucopus]|nr:acetyl-CoA synthetase-like protein [Phlegmacium glaucopus]